MVLFSLALFLLFKILKCKKEKILCLKMYVRSINLQKKKFQYVLHYRRAVKTVSKWNMPVRKAQDLSGPIWGRYLELSNW